MLNLNEKSLSYILLEPEMNGVSDYQNNVNCEKTCSVLYSKDFSVFQLKEYSTDSIKRCYLGVSTLTNNDEIRNEALSILNFLDINQAILKYTDETEPVKIYKDGNELPLRLKIYESADNSKKYLFEGVSFSFEEQLRYFYPKKKEHLKKGMVVEFMNNNKWNQKTILDLEDEYTKLYELLIKYNKLRIVI